MEMMVFKLICKNPDGTEQLSEMIGDDNKVSGINPVFNYDKTSLSQFLFS